VEAVANAIEPAARRRAARRCLFVSPMLAVAGVAIGIQANNVSYYGILKQRVETCNGMIPEPGWVLPLAGIGAIMAVAAVTATLAGRILLRPNAQVTRGDLPPIVLVVCLSAVGWPLGTPPWIATPTIGVLLLLAAASFIVIPLAGAIAIVMRLRASPEIRRQSSWLVPATLAVGLLAVLVTMMVLGGIYADAPTTTARLCHG
jgi:hypothetical protein